MLKNESPKWSVAVTREIIRKTVEEEFDVYVDMQLDELSVFFLPHDVADRIPEVDRDLFIEWYDFYAALLGKEINLNNIFEKSIRFPMNERAITQLKDKIAQQIRFFDHTNKTTAKQMMLNTFGLYGK